MCGEPLLPSRLLFPVTHKDYGSDPAIALYWERIKSALAGAYLLTVFGYRAPASDAEALELMGQAWGDPKDRGLEEIEIIDIRPRDELENDWARFLHTSHHATMPDFYLSYMTTHPRRSCEDFFEATMQLSPQPERPLPRDADWDDLLEHIRPLIEQEQSL